MKNALSGIERALFWTLAFAAFAAACAGLAARAVDRAHAHDLMAIGVQVFERETFRSALRLGERALVALGQERDEARRVADAFEEHDTHMLIDSYAVRHDQAAYIGFLRRSTEMLDEVMKADRLRQAPGDTPAPDIDKTGKPASD